MQDLQPNCVMGSATACHVAFIDKTNQPRPVLLRRAELSLYLLKIVNTMNFVAAQVPNMGTGFTLKPWNYFDGLPSRHVREAPVSEQQRCAPQIRAVGVGGRK